MIISETWSDLLETCAVYFQRPNDFAAKNWKKFTDVTIIKLKNLTLKALQF